MATGGIISASSTTLFRSRRCHQDFAGCPNTKVRCSSGALGAQCLLSALPPTCHTTLSIVDMSASMQTRVASTPVFCNHSMSKSLLDSLIVLADVDPATAKTAIGVTGPFLSVFGFLFILRIVMSWYPKLPVGKLPYVLVYAPTEPFLKVTRKVIPPLAGVDVTPVVWFGLVSFLSEILVGPQGLLVLLSQQT